MKKYFYNKNDYHKAIIHFKKTINNKNKYFAKDEEILRKISKSYLYLSDNYDNNREYYLSKEIKSLIKYAYKLRNKRNLASLGIKYEVKGRPKSVYSIWNKMKKQDIPFEEVYTEV